MGIFVWLLVGIAAAVAVRFLVGLLRPGRRPPALAAAVLGGVVGGFIADLAIRGDAVTDFRGPTALGAVLGAVLMLALADRLGWRAGSAGAAEPPASA